MMTGMRPGFGNVKIDRFLFIIAVCVAVVAFLLKGIKLTEPQSKPPVTLTFLQWWENDADAAALRALITEFEKANPDITVTLDTRSRYEVHDAALKAVPMPPSAPAPSAEDNEDAPPPPPVFDIIAFDPLWKNELRNAGILANLNDLADRIPVYVMEEISEAPEDATTTSESAVLLALNEPWSTHSDDAWALPVTAFVHLLFYNIDLLSEAGFDRPPKTLADFTSMCRAFRELHPGNEVFPAAFSADLNDSVLPWLLAVTPQRYAEANRLSDAAKEATHAFLAGLGNDHLVMSPLFSMPQREVRALFARGAIALYTGSAADIQQLRTDQAKRAGKKASQAMRFSVTTVPQDENHAGRSIMRLSAWYCGIGATTAHEEEALLFLRFLAKNRGRLARIAGAIPGDIFSTPTTESLAEAALLDRDAVYAKTRDLYQGAFAVSDWLLAGVDLAALVPQTTTAAVTSPPATSLPY